MTDNSSYVTLPADVPSMPSRVYKNLSTPGVWDRALASTRSGAAPALVPDAPGALDPLVVTA